MDHLPASDTVPTPEKVQVIRSRRPLADAAKLLEEIYAKPVTYEEAPLQWRGPLDVFGDDPQRWGALMPMERSFSFPAEARPDKTPVLDAALVGRVLDVYHQQNDGPRFQVVSTKYGLHIVPTKVHDSSGTLVPVTSQLDAIITVPVAKRTPDYHLVALCDAVTRATGLSLGPATTSGIIMRPWFDWAFGPREGASPRVSNTLGEEDVEAYSFEWGVNGIAARDALIGLLDRSATTMTWRLFCQSSARLQDRLCVLNIGAVVVSVTGPDGQPMKREVIYDRCVHCPPLRPSRRQ